MNNLQSKLVFWIRPRCDQDAEDGSRLANGQTKREACFGPRSVHGIRSLLRCPAQGCRIACRGNSETRCRSLYIRHVSQLGQGRSRERLELDPIRHLWQTLCGCVCDHWWT
eukprot:6456431-Amphidinium_carterae.1